VDRILFAVFTHENLTQGLATPSPYTGTLDVTSVPADASSGQHYEVRALRTRLLNFRGERFLLNAGQAAPFKEHDQGPALALHLGSADDLSGCTHP
jgi:hypothetical protein